MLRVLLVAATAFAVLSLSACEPECVDKYDCRRKGINLICSDKGRCVPDPDTPFPNRQPDFGGPSTPDERVDGGDFEPWDGSFPPLDGGLEPWDASFPPVDAGSCLPQDILCDGLDNDCDGYTDIGTPQLLWHVSELRPSLRWMRTTAVRIDGGVALVGGNLTVYFLDESGALVARNAGAAPSIAYGPIGTPAVVIPRPGGGFRAMQTVNNAVFAQDLEADGRYAIGSDGGAVVDRIAVIDGGSILTPSTGALAESGASLYGVREVFTYPYLASPGQAPVARTSVAAVAAIVPAGGDVFLVAEFSRVGAGGRFHSGFWQSANLVDAGRELDAGAFDYAVGIHRLGSDSTLVIMGGATSDGVARQVRLWNLADGSVGQLGAAGRFADPSLAWGDELLIMAIDPSVPDAGTERLLAISGDGGTRVLARWIGRQSYAAPTAVILDSRRALAVWGYPGPMDAGYYAVPFCR